MARERILSGDSAPGGGDDDDRNLRPQRIADMVGQRDVIARLRIAIDAAMKRGEPLGHILFDGPPGLGKTTFATCIPQEMGARVEFASGAGLKAPKDLVPYLTNAEENSVLFIDEIHRLPTPVEEYLYTAMEDFRIDIVIGDGINARTHNLWLKPFTLIGATTRAGMLTGPLRDRFQIREHLGFYTVEELTEIVLRNASKLRLDLQADAAEEVARRSRSTPRIANNRLLWVRDYADSKANGQVTLQVAMDALKMQAIDKLGLDQQDRSYLETIIRVFGGGPVGIEAIAHTMNAATDTLTDEVEPFLLRSELLVRTPRGRVATAKAYQHLKLDPPEDGSDGGQTPLFN
ncbi:MAG TPA: Holliday junction branch migration DNA helicase RuvB [Planctomycetaceae bacterium]|nr:Holliday junction branch migration DNA helicase RuvB [Planctomycetaceae bacterium]